MRKPYWALVLIIICLQSIPLLSQEEVLDEETKTKEEKVDKDVQKAYDAFEAEEYYIAIELLKNAFTEAKGRDKKSEILFMTGECYRKINDYKYAENYYEKAVKLGYKDPVAQLYLGDMLKAQGEYEEAIEVYQEYKKKNPSDRKGEIGIESTRKAAEWQQAPSLYQVANMKDINSRNMDFSPIYGGKARENDVIVFVSSREESEGSWEDGWTGQSFMDLYVTSAERKKSRRRNRGNDDKVDNAADLKWSTPVPLDEAGIVNSKHHEGTAAFDSRKKELYFTKCIKENNVKLGCSIWKTEKQGQNWKEPELVVIGEDTTANVGHPSLSPDDKYLYFVSDGFNSRGGRDIFLTTYDRRSRSWSTPKNLGPKVNTDRDEYYPFAHSNGYLYFSSNGLPGMGGLDIFRVKVGSDGMPMEEAENMKYPINTNYEDFGLVFEPGSDERGFLSSNRKGGRGSDDIYAVFKTPVVFMLEGVVTSSKTGRPIPQATVRLDGSDGTSVVINADNDGYYIFDKEKINKETSYKLTFEKKKFLSSTGDITTIGIPLSAFEYVPSANEYQNMLRLNKALDPIEEPIVLPNVFFDLAKWDLRPESRLALDSVVTILSNNPTIVIELRSHTDYRDSEASNQILSQKRADTCVSYLISKGIAADRLVAKGMGESEPFRIPESYKFYGAGKFSEGQVLSEAFIKKQAPELQEVANQINRRTDFKVLRDDYVPAEGLNEPEAVDPRDIIEQKKNEVAPPGKIHIVKGRQSLGVIARQYKINIRELKSLNGGLRGVRPFEGLQLKVEPDGNYEEWDASHYQVKGRGMKLKNVAKEIDIDDDILEDLNPDWKGKDLQPGLWVKIK